MFNIKDSDGWTDADTTKEPTNYNYSYSYNYGPPPPTPVSYDGTNRVELVKIGRDSMIFFAFFFCLFCFFVNMILSPPRSFDKVISLFESTSSINTELENRRILILRIFVYDCATIFFLLFF